MQTTAATSRAGELERFVHDFYDAFLESPVDWDRLLTMLIDDYQQLDERSGTWYRGDPATMLATHRAEIESAESYTHRIEDVDVRLLTPDVGVATYVWYADARWDEQDYHIRCPSTMVVRREADGWRAAVLHAVPAEDRSASS
jgi:hypothetical protein